MPVNEHPFDGSWGYQPTGLLCADQPLWHAGGFRRVWSMPVTAKELASCSIGCPATFPTILTDSAISTAPHFTNTPTRCRAATSDWGTLIYNYGRTEVANFLVANALFWLDRYGVDGLRVDAVASMLYLDYSRPEGGWIPNKHGGRENLEAIEFMRRFNREVFAKFPDATTAAEESTAWPLVSRPIEFGGLGFGYKWNMGWMHDTLNYIGKDPIHRKHHHGQILFGLHYAFSENFILPLSHDEVVHGKRSILGRMPGDDWQRFANLRAYYAFMFGHPGKKLMFMGCGVRPGTRMEPRPVARLASSRSSHAIPGVQAVIRDLNALYRDVPALHELDCDPAGLRMDRTQRCRSQRLCLDAQGRKRRGDRCLVDRQFHADRPSRLPRARTLRRQVARGAQHRFRSLRRQQCREQRRWSRR